MGPASVRSVSRIHSLERNSLEQLDVHTTQDPEYVVH